MVVSHERAAEVSFYQTTLKMTTKSVPVKVNNTICLHLEKLVT